MQKIIMMRGLPGSGKSTWSREYLKDHPNAKRVCKDDLRSMIDDGRWSKNNEKYILSVRNVLVRTSLMYGHDVIVDDTNLSPKHEEKLRDLSKEVFSLDGKILEVQFEVKDFTGVPLEECIKRDKKRPNYVGESVIRKMYNDYLAPRFEPVKFDNNLPSAIICDIDGTLALFGDADPYNRDFSRDALNVSVKMTIDSLLIRDPNLSLFITSGRMGRYKDVTLKWLKDNEIIPDEIFMRPNDDLRDDAIIKEEFYTRNIKDKYNVIAVFDDRLRVCRMWHRLGLPLFRIGDPDADF